MIVEFAFGVVITFLIVVTGSYIGAKMALNTFFGRNFLSSETDQFTPSNSASDE